MRSIYLIVTGAVIAVVGGLAFWKRDYIKSKFTGAVPKAKGMASKAWGAVRDTASEQLHTEVEDHPNAAD